MWIEIYKKETEEKHLINTDTMGTIELSYGTVYIGVVRAAVDDFITLKGESFYAAFIMALHGNDVDLGELGHVKPLRNSQREEIAKRLNYLDAISDIKTTN